MNAPAHLDAAAGHGTAIRLAHKLLSDALAKAGVTLDGPNRWDPRLVRPRAVTRVLLHGSLGAGDAYSDGDWECDALDELADRLVTARRLEGLPHGLLPLGSVWSRALNRQGLRGARANVAAHYDRWHPLFTSMLGATLAYSCGYWKNARSLDDAQAAKHELICDKLELTPAMRLLDIGCGWGAFAEHAALGHGVSVLGVTLSPSQAELATERTRHLPIDIRVQDYRQVNERFDRIVSIGMFEHVGADNHRVFFERAAKNLEPSGLMLLHCIGGDRSTHSIDPWIDRHVFPGAVLPSMEQISRAAEGLFVMEDWHNFGADYDRTLLAWHQNLESAWPSLGGDYDERTRRMWRYYLLTCAGTFRARKNQLWQLVFSPRGVRGGYRRVS